MKKRYLKWIRWIPSVLMVIFILVYTAQFVNQFSLTRSTAVMANLTVSLIFSIYLSVLFKRIITFLVNLYFKAEIEAELLRGTQQMCSSFKNDSGNCMILMIPKINYFKKIYFSITDVEWQFIVINNTKNKSLEEVLKECKIKYCVEWRIK